MNSIKLKNITLTDVSAVLLGLVAIQLPVYHLYLSLTIGAWILLSITTAIYLKQWIKVNVGFALLILFYGLLALSRTWSENMTVANFDLEVKMSLVIFPFVLMFSRISLKHVRLILYFFITGIVVGATVLVISASMDYLNTKSVAEFFYVELSPRIHPSYYSFYLNIGILILLFDYITARLTLFSKKWIYILLIAGFAILSIFLLSKGGILATILLLGALMTHWVLKKRIIQVVVLLVITTLAFGTIYLKSEDMQDRASELFQGLNNDGSIAQNQHYSTGIRIAIWTEAFYLSKKQPLVGYGSGDVKDVLMERYDIKGVSIALIRNLNAHNQFLQTALSIGGLGVLILLGILFYPFFVRGQIKWLAISFSCISIVFFMTESVLETQAGVISFALFYCILNVTMKEDLPGENTSTTQSV